MKQLLRYILMACVACVCGIVVVLLHVRIKEIRASIAEQMQYVENAPAQQQYAEQLAEQLAIAQTQADRLSQHVISQDKLVLVVESISRAAAQSGVSVQIPNVQNADENSGILEDIRLRMNAVGSPANLIAFLYRVEHAPYLLNIASWNLDTTYQSTAKSFAGTIPPDPSGGKPKPRASVTGSALSVEAVISIIKQ